MDGHRAGAVVQAPPPDEARYRLALPAGHRVWLGVWIRPPKRMCASLLEFSVTELYLTRDIILFHFNLDLTCSLRDCPMLS